MKKEAIDSYGMDAFNRVAGRRQLRERLEYWLRNEDVPLDDKQLVEDAAGDFLALHRYDFASALKRTSPRVVIRGGGSLARVAAYAEALPAVLQAREEVLGTREPLSRTEALDWLIQETHGSEKRSLVEVRFRFLVPKASPVLWRVQSGLSGPDLLSALDEEALHTPIAPGAERPSERPMETSLVMSMGPDDRRTEVDLYRGTSDRYGALLSWASRLSGRCVGGAVSSDAPDYAEAIEAAVWLILAGIWPRVSASAVAYRRRGWSLVSSPTRPRPQAPYMLVRVEAMETPPEAVANAYKSLRNAAKLTQAGRPLEAEAEVLCMAAADVVEIDGIAPGSGGFLAAVLRRYWAKAKDHDVSQDEFPDTPAGRDKARKALARARRTYGKRYSGGIAAEAADATESARPTGAEPIF